MRVAAFVFYAIVQQMNAENKKQSRQTI